MPTLVYAHPRNYPAAEALVASLRASGESAVLRNGARFDPKHDCERAGRVVAYDLPVVAEAYRGRGVEVESVGPVLPVAPSDLPAPVQAPAAGGGDPVSQVVVQIAPPAGDTPAELLEKVERAVQDRVRRGRPPRKA